jgi:hypothetical protein
MPLVAPLTDVADQLKASPDRRHTLCIAMANAETVTT